MIYDKYELSLTGVSTHLFNDLIYSENGMHYNIINYFKESTIEIIINIIH